MQLMLQAHDTLCRVWELAVSFLGLPPLARVPRENTNRRGTVQRRTIWIADAHRDGKRFPSKEIRPPDQRSFMEGLSKP